MTAAWPPGGSAAATELEGLRVWSGLDRVTVGRRGTLTTALRRAATRPADPDAAHDDGTGRLS